MDEIFIRQRRNLLVTSIIVFLISYAGIEIGNQVTLLGTKFNIKDPIIIYITIWIMLFYFLIRYFQYFIDLDSEYREYNFPTYPWGGFQEHHSYNILNIIWLTIVFIFMNLLGILTFTMNSFIHKNFSETLLPIIFAVIVIYASLQAPFTQNKYTDATSKLNTLKAAVYQELFGDIVINYNKTIDKYDTKIKELYNN